MKPRVTLLFAVIISLLIINLSSFAEIRVFFSPDGSAAKEIITQIDNAKSYIDIAMYSFTYEPIGEAIIRAKNRGIRIRILMDKGQSKGKYSKYNYLLSNNIAIIQDRHAGIMHNKIAIIDGKVLFTGSYNWSKSAEEKNQENLLEFIDESTENKENSFKSLYEKKIIEIYQKRLNYLWEFNDP